MNKVLVEIYHTGNNFCAHAPVLPGCVSTATSLSEIKNNIKEAIEFHVESSIEKDDHIPEVFNGSYELDFKISVEALLNAYSDVFTKAALSRITGINQRQLWHYAAGLRKPRPLQRKRIEEGLHFRKRAAGNRSLITLIITIPGIFQKIRRQRFLLCDFPKKI